MLKALFVWLDNHPGSYWLIAFLPTLLLVVRVAAVAWRESRGSPSASTRAAWLDAVVLLLFLLAWRWPFLLVAADFNPDESQLISGAFTLAHDPVFWRSIDGTTSGPLNFYILLPLHWLGFPLDYFMARLMGLMLVGGALVFCHRALVRLFGRTTAWLGVLPATLFFATVTHPDYVHFSSEHLPLFLIAFAIWLLAGREAGDRLRLWAGCFVVGTLPWAKLQTGPVCLVLMAWGLWQVVRDPGITATIRFRRMAGAVAAAAVPTLLASSLILATGQAETALRRYVLHNFIYVGYARPLPDAFRELAHRALADGSIPLLLAPGLTVVLLALAFYAIRRIQPTIVLGVGGLLTLVTALAILTPRREFLHYLLLLPVPLTLLIGAAVGGWFGQLEAARSRLLLVGGVFLACGLVPLIYRVRQPVPSIYGQFSYYWRYPRTRSAMVVRALAGKGDSLAIWGWACNLYVETGLRQATRDPHTPWSILPNQQRDYFRAVYLSDLSRSKPAVFVDAVGSGAFAFQERLTQAHEIFRELKDYIRDHYTLVTDLGDTRIYARNDLATWRTLTPAQLSLLLAKGRPDNGVDTLPPTITPVEQLQQKEIDHRSVRMLLPPTRVEWLLDADVREVAIEFGFDPVAYEQGHSDGADLIVELVYSQNTRPVFRRRLDPAQQLNDRGLQSALITLPPFPAGTHLVVRTDPGPNGNNAWDWVYLANLQLRRSKEFTPQQFPGFNRVPDSADAVNSGLVEENGERFLQLHAPGSITYVLTGSEQRMRFDLGFRAGAYTNGGYTDGAIFRVELTRPDQPVRILFERFLQPTLHAGDRGRQHIDLALPVHAPGDRLTLSTDPGPAGNAAWDWTYITNLNLE